MGRMGRRQEERRQRIAQIGVGLLMAFLMVFSILGYALQNRASVNNEYTYNGARFSASQDGFRTDKTGDRVFTTAPVAEAQGTVTLRDAYGNTARVSLDPAALAALDAATYLALTFDPETPQPGITAIEVARFDLQRALPNAFGGVLYNSTAYPLPVITCAGAQPDLPVIELRYANETYGEASVAANGACITVQGDVLGLLAAKDVLLYHDAGVIA